METIRSFRPPVNLSLTPNELLEPIRKEVKDHGGDMVEFNLKDEFSLSSDERNTYARVKHQIADAISVLKNIKDSTIDNSKEDLNPKKGEILLRLDNSPGDNYWLTEIHMKDGEPVTRTALGDGAFYCHAENDKTIINSYSRREEKDFKGCSKVVGAGGILNKDPDTNTITSGYLWEYNYKKEEKL